MNEWGFVAVVTVFQTPPRVRCAIRCDGLLQVVTVFKIRTRVRCVPRLVKPSFLRTFRLRVKVFTSSVNSCPCQHQRCTPSAVEPTQSWTTMIPTTRPSPRNLGIRSAMLRSRRAPPWRCARARAQTPNSPPPPRSPLPLISPVAPPVASQELPSRARLPASPTKDAHKDSPAVSVDEVAPPAPFGRLEAVCIRQADVEGRSLFQRQQFDGPVHVGMLGLEGSTEYHRSAHYKLSRPQESAADRGVLLQTTAHLHAVEAYAASAGLRQPLAPQVAGLWGENLFVSGEQFDSSVVCVGDVLAFVGRDLQPTGVRMCVTSPRLPCSKVDQKHGSTYSVKGMRAQCARTGWGGIFCRVLSEGSIESGDTLELESRPHPAWPLPSPGNRQLKCKGTERSSGICGLHSGAARGIGD